MEDLFPCLDPAEAAARRLLVGEGRYLPVTVAGQSFEFGFRPEGEASGEPSSLLPVEIDGETSLIAIQFLPQGRLAGRFPEGLPPGPDELRSAVLAVMARELLDALSASLNATIGIAAAPPVPPGSLRLHFRLAAAGSPPESAPEAWGYLEPGVRFLSLLQAAASGWIRKTGPLAASSLASFPVVLGTLELESSSLAGLRPGDMLVVCPAEATVAELRLPGGRSLKCALPPALNGTDSHPV